VTAIVHLTDGPALLAAPLCRRELTSVERATTHLGDVNCRDCLARASARILLTGRPR
jgi:hypothetical protein